MVFRPFGIPEVRPAVVRMTLASLDGFRVATNYSFLRTLFLVFVDSIRLRSYKSPQLNSIADKQLADGGEPEG